MTREVAEKQFGTFIDVVWPFIEDGRLDTILAEIKKQKGEGKVIVPEVSNVFRAFRDVKLEDLRFVIIGQDPYPTENTANGLAFAIEPGGKIPPSLALIYDAIHRDAGNNIHPAPKNGDLTYLCAQGGLLINTAYTTVLKTPNSHSELWRPFTEFLITRLQEVTRGILWFAWGKEAQLTAKAIDIFGNGHFILGEEHPVASLYRAKQTNTPAKWDAKCFSKANAIIRANKLGELINW